MIKKILLLTDFSDNALHSALYACKIANSVHAEMITLLHTFDPAALLSPNEMSSLLAPVEATGIFTNYEWAAEQIETIKKENAEELENLKQKLLPEINSNTHIICRVETLGLIQAVNQICEEQCFDIVIMGIKGRTGLEKALIGSNATKAIESIHQPLLIIPQHAAIDMPERIVMATDLKTINEKIFIQLDKIFKSFEAKILALNIMNKNQDINIVKKEAAPLQQQLIKYSTEFHFILSDDIETGINLFAIDHHASLIVSLHKTKSFFDSLFHKSITKNLAWHSKIPLLVLNIK